MIDLQFVDKEGYTWYLNHLISFLVCSPILFWACRKTIIGGHANKEQFLHTAVSALLTVLFIKGLLLLHCDDLWWIGPALAFALGLGKEIRDNIMFPHKTELKKSLNDLFANFLGILGVSVLYFFSFLNAY